MGRAPCCDKANVKKGPWSPEEDAKLKEYIEKYGTGGNWIALPQKAGLRRCGKSCRLRWLNYLRPNIKHGEFSDDEDGIICSLYASIGSRWSIIAAQLPGRTDNDIKNYWNTKLKKKLMGSMNSSSITSNNISPKKPHHFHQYSMLSSISSPSLLSPSLSMTTPSPYQCISSTYYNSPSPNTTMSMSFTGGACYNTFDTTSPSPSINNSTVLQAPLTTQNYHRQHHAKENATLLMFGGDQPSCSSNSDGSCSVSQAVVKREDHMEHDYGFYNNGVHHQEDQKPSVNAGVWGQNSQSNSLVDYGLEEIKQLISTNINVGNSFNYFDGTQAVEEGNTKVMYYY